MRRQQTALVLLWTALLPSGLAAQQVRLPDDSVVRQAEREGRKIADYDFAVRNATRALMAQNPAQNRISLYVARRQNELWHVYFGSFNVLSSEFRVAYEVVQRAKGSGDFEVRDYPKSPPAVGDLRTAAVALVTALDAFDPRWERYFTYVWKDDSGRWVAYFLPGQTSEGKWPIGGDERVLLSADGHRILEVTTFHANVTVVVPSREAAIATHHKHLLYDEPAPTDFAYVLMAPELAPMKLVMSRFSCIVNRKGLLTGCTPN